MTTPQQARKVLILGGQGQLAQALVKHAPAWAHTAAISRAQLDITDTKELSANLRQYSPDIIINAAAVTDVDACEQKAKLANEVNAYAVMHLAEFAEALGVYFVHMSTDYVFSGYNAPDDGYDLEDQTGAINVYGMTKRLAEIFIEQTCRRSLIVRTSWLYGSRSIGFVPAIQQRLQSMQELQVVDDQWGCPTSCDALAVAVFKALAAEHQGILHLAGLGGTSRFGFAEEIASVLGLPQSLVEPCGSDLYPRPAPRPLDTRLKCATPYGMRDWRESLRSYFSQEQMA